MKKNIIKSTTIIGIRKDNHVVIAGDGQASMGNTIMKPNVKKVRRLGVDESLIAGFAGSTRSDVALFHVSIRRTLPDRPAVGTTLDHNLLDSRRHWWTVDRRSRGHRHAGPGSRDFNIQRNSNSL